MIYDERFTTLSEAEFVQTAMPLVIAYRDAMARRDTQGQTKQADITEARNALTAHCNAWAITKPRKAFVDGFVLRECYEKE